MLFDTAAAALDWLGVIVFAISGALVASRKQMDVVGFALLGTVTGIGGGTLRDLLLAQEPVFWVREPAYLDHLRGGLVRGVLHGPHSAKPLPRALVVRCSGPCALRRDRC